ncbi:tumor protein D54-like isoform X2 [Oncorhynchus nerka]|uniref:tumor protein D54-like isoform X2 n=1 Tax=Oncorhynchus nerka TaxID=8023 RepID=UPI0031B8013B
MPLLIMNRQGYSGENVSPRNISIGISGIGSPTNGLSEEDEFDLKMELAKTEDEIQTLRQVLLAKEKYAMDIRRQLGTGPFSEIKQNLSKGWQEVQTSNAYLTASATLEDISQSNVYKRTQESISNAGQMTSAALSTVGVAITRRLGDMRVRTIRPWSAEKVDYPRTRRRRGGTRTFMEWGPRPEPEPPPWTDAHPDPPYALEGTAFAKPTSPLLGPLHQCPCYVNETFQYIQVLLKTWCEA